MTTETLTEPTTSINFDTLDRGTRFVKLRTPIQPEELANIAAQLAARTQELLTIDSEKSDILSEFRDRTKTAKDEQKRLLGEYQSQTREKDVQCETGYDWTTGRKYTRRLDTGELLDANGEEIPDTERQMQLDGFDAAGILALKVIADDEKVSVSAEGGEEVADDPESETEDASVDDGTEPDTDDEGAED